MLPHPEKVDKGGEDAYFIAEDGLALGITPFSFTSDIMPIT